MKRKTRFLVVLCILSIMTCSMSVRAQDSIAEPEPVIIEEPILELEPEIFEEPEPDEEPPGIETPEALTPEGNLSLVDDLEAGDENKQFLTVVSKGGNYFYVIVDRSVDGENNVHFLNQVDEEDLKALTEDGETVTEAVCVCEKKCVPGEVNTFCAVCSVNLADCLGKAPEPTPEPTPEPEAEPEKSSGSAGMVILFILIVGGAGAAFYYIKFIKGGANKGGSSDLDEYDFGDDDEDEDDYDDEDYDDEDDEDEDEFDDEDVEDMDELMENDDFDIILEDTKE